MEVIQARNVNDAYVHGLVLLRDLGETQQSRAGEVLVYPTPVTTVYAFPMERVLFDVRRDANPFFHLMESLWMLAGRNDATWLDQFVGDFSKRFAEDDGQQHGAYGFRWRNHFDVEGGGDNPDQLDTIVELLKQNPNDRRVVLTMWDPVADLGRSKRDIPCNTHAYLRVRHEARGMIADMAVLDITVCCRSNDAVWGVYGANAVHFSVLQEYLAARIGVGVGKYYQVSNNFHVYAEVLKKVLPLEISTPIYQTPIIKLVDDPESFDRELSWFFHYADKFEILPLNYSEIHEYKNRFIPNVAIPMLEAARLWRKKWHEAAVATMGRMPNCDWKVAAQEWMGRRMIKLAAKAGAENVPG
jgi:thymidylate synthase